MVSEDKLLRGSKRYLRAIGSYGMEDILDQVKSHTIVEEHGSLGKYPMIVTEKYVICVSRFIIALDELEIFDITPVGLHAFPIVTAADNKGSIYRVRVLIGAEAQKKILSAVSSRGIYTIKGYSPEAQLDYKRRHADEILRNAREMMADTTIYRYDAKFLYHNRFLPISIFMIVLGLLYPIRLTDAQKTSQIVAFILISCLFVGFGVALIIRGIKRKKHLTEQIGGNAEELVAEINDRLVYTPNTQRRRGVFVTSKYLILTGECALRREDVVWFHTYTHKSTQNICVGDKNGKSYSTGVPAEYHDWETEEAIIGSLLPNAAVGDTDQNRKYFEQFKT